MSGKSLMVVATKYRLLEAVSQKDHIYNKKGAKKEISTKLVSRAFVEERNSRDNNELYIIDEEETKKILKLREKEIKRQAEEKKKEQVSNADVVDALVNKIVDKKKPKKEETPKKEKTTKKKK